nr:ribonuclease H-like domain, reverse transcriptase, RNA-dependent DNA polymerase [Tanacetum cinerariifolium]
MTTSTFVKTHNLIAYLVKPAESEGFEQIIDFLNRSSVRYALTASPTICTSCIKLFWSTSKVKTVNDKVRVQALIDGKKVTIKESSIRRTLRLDDAEGTSCLANDDIFTGLANMGYEKMSYKLTFYKAFFSPQWKLVKNIKDGVPFYMFPRFVQLLIDHQIGDMSHRQDIYDNPSLTKKVFANMKRVSTSFSGVTTLLFKSMLVQAVEEVGQGQDDVSIPTEPSTSKPYKKHKSKKQQPNAPKVPSLTPSPEHQLPSPLNDPIHTAKDSLTLPELMDLCTILSNKVLDLESEPAEVEKVLEIVKAAKLMTEVVTTAQPTTTTATQVPKPSTPRRRRDVVTQDPKETVASVIMHSENDVIEQVKRSEKKDNTVMRYQALKRKPVTEAQARKNMMIYLKNMAGFKMDFFKEVTPLASKVPVVDYQIHHENNKPYYKIIRVDGTHKLFLSFITLLKNFDREDLEALWKLVKEIFETTKPKNFSYDFLLNILKIMFEKPNIKANMILLVEKKYPLTHFTLQQMLDNVRLEVKEESEMSLELLSALFPDTKEKSYVHPYNFPSMILQKIIWICHGGLMLLENQLDLGFHKFDTQSTTTALSIENRSLIKGEKIMADVNFNVNVPAEQAPVIAPPTRIDDQILPWSRWVPVGKSNCYLDVEKDTARYICQLDEQWFDLTKDTLKDALQITPLNNNNPFSSLSTPDALINLVNNLGYSKVVITLFVVMTNGMFQPYKKNLALHTQGKKKANPIVIPSIRFTKLIIHHLKSKHKFHLRLDSLLHFPYEEYILGYLKFSAKGTKREVFRMPIPNKLITADIRGEQYYKEYLEKVAKHQRYLSSKEGSDLGSPAPKPLRLARSTSLQDLKQYQSQNLLPQNLQIYFILITQTCTCQDSRKETSPRLVDEFVNEGIPEREPRFNDEEADMQREVEKILKSVHNAHRGPLPPVTPKKMSTAEQYIFQRCTPTQTEPLCHVESPSIYAKPGMTDSDTESNKEVPLVVKIRAQDEGHAGPNPGVQIKVDEIVTDAVDWDIQALLWNRFRDLPEADMKEILHQRMWETNSYKAHEDHMMLYEALEKSMNHDHTDELITDLAKARRKKRKRHDSLKTPPLSLPHQPPPPLPPASLSGTLGSSRAFGSSQLPLPPPPPSTSQSDQPYVSLIPKDLHMDDDTYPDEQVHSSDDEDIWNARIPKTGDMAIFINWFYKKQGFTKLNHKTWKALHLTLLKSSILMYNVSKPLPLGGPPGQVIIQSDFFFNKDLEYLRYGSKSGRHALSISKMKAAYYPDVRLEKMVPDQMWIEEECKYDIAAIDLSVVRIEVYSMYGYDYMKKIVLHRADLNEHIITKRDFKYLYPSNFEDRYLLNLQGHLNHLPPKDKKILTTAVNL